jgi:hypothetical protein
VCVSPPLALAARPAMEAAARAAIRRSLLNCRGG